MSLQDWLRNGWLVEHKTSREELRSLFALADRDLIDSQVPALSPDWRFNIAYNAALQAATAALAVTGFRAAREAHHYRVIQSLAYTVKADTKLVDRLDKFRKKRNVGGYERAGSVSEGEVTEMVTVARKLREDIEVWIRQVHPKLLQGG